MSNIQQRYIDEYLSKNHENATLETLDGLIEHNVTAAYDELSKRVIDGYPMGSYRDEGGKLRFIFQKNCHELILGSTGAGKTTGIVEPSVRALSSLKNKPHLVITDPKGELFKHHSDHLKKKGYKLYVLNFKDASRSDMWNPIQDICDDYMKLATEMDHDKAEAIKVSVDDQINAFCSMILAVTSTTDKSWELGAREYLKGLIYYLLEEAIAPDTTMTKDKFNMYNIRRLSDMLRVEQERADGRLRHNRYFKHKASRIPTPESVICTRPVLENAPTTRRSYIGVFSNCTSDYLNNKVFSMTSCNTVDLDSFEKGPVAVFIITRDYESVDYKISGLFIDWLYRKLVARAENKPNGTLDRDVHFYLDEFGNISELPLFGRKISTSRSRGIFFHLILQSYAQLAQRYTPDGGVEIKYNCSSLVYLGSPNHQTRQIFSEECGRTTVASLRAHSEQQIYFEERPLVTVSDLSQIEEGDAYVRRASDRVAKTHYERSYKCPEFDMSADGSRNLPVNKNVFTSDTFTYYPPGYTTTETAKLFGVDDF